MTSSKIRESVLSERIAWTRDMLNRIRQLPLGSFESFSADGRNAASAESYLRRALEALMDTGRHILAKGFAADVPDYKGIADKLLELKVIDSVSSEKMKILAGYRNRMVHFYNEISDRELHAICSEKLDDVILVLDGIIRWVGEHPEMIDRKI
jgi:uncharacterized protein YutE (UPF0331/DUF86 family)